MGGPKNTTHQNLYMWGVGPDLTEDRVQTPKDREHAGTREEGSKLSAN
jgi:hypothetical protein